MIVNKQKVAYFAGLSAFLGVIENCIPMPVPFLRIGFSNIPVMIALTMFNFNEMFFIIMFKVVISHLFRGTLLSVPFFIGLAGNMLLLLTCFPFYRICSKYVSFISLSVLAATAHNFGQILVAFVFLPPSTVYHIGIFLLSIGTVTGVITGCISNRLYNTYISEA